MNEIEKMYILAGIRKGRMSDEDCAEYCLDYECKNCRYNNYPQFTAEKQIAILITLANYNLYEDTKKLLIDSFNGEIYIGFYRDIDLIANATDKEFAECVAKLVNNLWQDLTEEDKTSIKNILEM